MYLLFLQDSSLVGSVVRKLLLNFIARPSVPFNRTAYSIFYDGSQSSVLQGVGSAAGMVTGYTLLFDIYGSFEIKYAFLIILL